MKKIICSILAISLVWIVACQSQKNDDPQPASSITKESARWLFSKGNDKIKPTYEIRNNELVLSANADTAKALKGASIWYNELLKGDFEVILSLDSLSATTKSATPEFSTTLMDSVSGKIVYDASTSFSKGTISANLPSLAPASTLKYTMGNTTPFDVVYKRVGNSLSVSVKSKNGTILVSNESPNFGTRDLFMNLFVGDRGSLDGTAKGYISSVKITGGSTQYSGDDFSQDRVFVMQ